MVLLLGRVRKTEMDVGMDDAECLDAIPDCREYVG